MAIDTQPKATKRPPVYYLIIDFRNDKLYSQYYKGIDAPDCSIRKSSSGSKRVVVIRAKLLPKRVLPHFRAFHLSLPDRKILIQRVKLPFWSVWSRCDLESHLRHKRLTDRPDSIENTPCTWVWCTLNPLESNVISLLWCGNLEKG
ncbi:hypothetical protein AVEN_259997-1 [Araneus ventricosus]|uniref:Uncharacterized protein n=1 Tax=Araneus ventricosus TaxID=182803 RepID=A0A4Y2H352_ARAVE|nr:hypothetical protein AVEN_259997-1 [Araneus ventricosus]